MYFIFKLDVRFEYQLNVQDETLSNALSVKDQCANTITSSLNTKLNIDDVSTLPAISDTANGVTCNSGVYDLSSSTPSYQYMCQGNRRFYNQGGQLFCCK
jgi:hypothetical protein